MNKVFLLGRLARDPEMRTTASGTSVTRFTIVVNKGKDKDGNDGGADFIGCIAWRKIAENIAKYCTKGSPVALSGHINVSSYDGPDGQRHYNTDIVADSVTFLESPKNKQESGHQTTPQEQPQVQEDPFASFEEEVVLRDEDLPF